MLLAWLLLLLLSGLGHTQARNTSSPWMQFLTAWYPVLPHLVGASRWYDQSPSLAHATMVGPPLVKPDPTGRFAGLMSFTGTQYANIPQHPAWQYGGADLLSISCWFASTASGQMDLVGKYANTEPYTGYSLASSSTGVTWYMADETGGVGGDAGIVTTTGYHDGRLHHVVATYDGSRADTGMALYVDGQLQAVASVGYGTSFSGNPTNTEPGRIGANALANANWVGTISNVMLLNRTLTAAEVQALYQMQAPDYGGLVPDPQPLALLQLLTRIKRKVVLE